MYPTSLHAEAAEGVCAFFSARPDVEAVLLVGSTARGRASRDSCLDIAVLLRPSVLAAHRDDLTGSWSEYCESSDAIKSLRTAGAFSQVDLELIDGRFTPGLHTWTSGPDEFELEIGNYLVYSVPLWQHGDYLAELKARWLPYYSDGLRRERLASTRTFCINNLDHIPLFVDRGLYFQSFHRLYDAFGEFLQALFIARRTYPIAYNKWIREQVEEILGLPELYCQLPALFEIQHFESRELIGKAETLRRLVDIYTGE